MYIIGYNHGSINERRFEEWRAQKIFLKTFLLFLLQDFAFCSSTCCRGCRKTLQQEVTLWHPLSNPYQGSVYSQDSCQAFNTLGSSSSWVHRPQPSPELMVSGPRMLLCCPPASGSWCLCRGFSEEGEGIGLGARLP